MNDNSMVLIGTAVLAFFLGYLVVAFVIGRLKRLLSAPPKTNDGGDLWEEQRRQQEDYSKEQERIRQEEEAKRAEEEQQRRQHQEESRQSHFNDNRRRVKDEMYYGRILGLRGRVSSVDVRNRYRELAAQYHPDKVNHLGPKLKEVAEREMQEINEAFEYFKRRYG